MTTLNCSRLLLLGALIVSSVGCDQATKALATATIGGGPSLSYFGDTVRLTYAENPGGFLSLGADLPAEVRAWLFGIAPAGVVVVLLVPLVRSHSLRPAEVVALGLIVAGAVGNLIDRLLLGVVRDFMNVGIGPLRTGIFNVADLTVTLGVAIFCFAAARAKADAEMETETDVHTCPPGDPQ